MTVLHHAHDRIAFAAEGAALAAGDALDFIRDRSAAFAATLAAMIALVLLLLNLGGSAADNATPSAAAATAPADPTYVAERGYSLSLPSGWERTEAPDGAAFAATSPDGLAETTLWVERQPDMSFDAFLAKSTASLDELGNEVVLTDRVGGPTLESQIAELSAHVVLDGGAVAPYRVMLRAAGPYRYYLATSVQPGAPADLMGDAELLSGSFRPGR